MSEKMKDLGVRTASGLILGIVMLGAIYWSIWSCLSCSSQSACPSFMH